MNAAEPPVAHAEDNVTRASSIHDLRHQSIKVVRCPSVTAQSLQSLFGRPGNARAGITKDRIGIASAPASRSFIVPSFIVLLRGSSTASSRRPGQRPRTPSIVS